MPNQARHKSTRGLSPRQAHSAKKEDKYYQESKNSNASWGVVLVRSARAGLRRRQLGVAHAGVLAELGSDQVREEHHSSE
jgi:hypothetical protein